MQMKLVPLYSARLQNLEEVKISLGEDNDGWIYSLLYILSISIYFTTWLAAFTAKCYSFISK